MKRQLTITQEAAFGVYHTSSPVAINIRLDTPDSFRVMTVPEFWSIMSGSGFAVPALFGTQTTGLAATLRTPLDYAQASFLLGWSLQRINAGQTSPWTTTEIAGDLASCTCDYLWSNVDGTTRTKRFLGAKVATFGLSASRQSPVVYLELGLVASTPQGNTYDSSSDPTLSIVADSTFPTTPVLFQHARAGLTINNVAHTNFQSLSFSVQNRLKAYFDESRFANLIRMNGRTTTLSGSSRLKASPDDRTSYESAATLASANTLVFTNGTHTITFTLNAQNYFSQINESFPLDEEIYYSWTMQNLLDTAATTDFTFTYA
jgi:Phage tail tube protein